MPATDGEHHNLAAIKRGFDALVCGDVSAFVSGFHVDARWHAAPAGTLKGHYRGRDQIVGFFAHLAAETDGTFRIEPHAFAASGDLVFVQQLARATRNGVSVEWRSVLVFTLSGGVTTSVDHYSIDYPAIARFWQ